MFLQCLHLNGKCNVAMGLDQLRILARLEKRSQNSAWSDTSTFGYDPYKL